MIDKDWPIPELDFSQDCFMVDKMKQLQLQQAIKHAHTRRLKDEVNRILEMEGVRDVAEAYSHAIVE